MSTKSIFKRSTWAGLLLVFVAALTLEATWFVQSYLARKGLEEETLKRAESELKSSRNQIMDVIDQAEAAVRHSIWIAQWSLDYPDSLHRVCYRMVEDNPVLVGSSVALVPGHNRRRPLYAPYVCRDGDSLVYHSLATEAYDYPSQEWFVKPIELGEGYWSEPYFDTGGGEVLMTTFSVPIRDKRGQPAAVLTGDISLDGLSDVIGNIQIYPHATALMISRTGRFMVSQNKELVMQKTVHEVVESIRDNKDFKELNRAMLAGETGNIRMKYLGSERFVYYAPIERTGWSMCIVIPHEDIYADIRRIGRIVLLFQLFGLAMLVLILLSLVQGQRKYLELEERKEKMQGELRIASAIQMSMVPKESTTLPEREDLDLAAEIVPAKEVGGDLYDYFIRDGKLFFCIADVSGKGIPASLVMAVTRTSFRTLSVQRDSDERQYVGNEREQYVRHLLLRRTGPSERSFALLQRRPQSACDPDRRHPHAAGRTESSARHHPGNGLQGTGNASALRRRPPALHRRTHRGGKRGARTIRGRADDSRPLWPEKRLGTP